MRQLMPILLMTFTVAADCRIVVAQGKEAPKGRAKEYNPERVRSFTDDDVRSLWLVALGKGSQEEKEAALSALKKIKAANGKAADLTLPEMIAVRAHWDLFGKETIKGHAIARADANLANETVQLLGLTDKEKIEAFKIRYGLLSGPEMFKVSFTIKLISEGWQSRLSDAQKDAIAPFRGEMEQFLKLHP